jgi:hypothetical protein
MRLWTIAILVFAFATMLSACDETNSRGAASPTGSASDGGEVPSAFPGGGW